MKLKKGAVHSVAISLYLVVISVLPNAIRGRTKVSSIAASRASACCRAGISAGVNVENRAGIAPSLRESYSIVGMKLRSSVLWPG